MAGYRVLKRLQIIIELLGHRSYLSKNELLNRMASDYDFVTTKRTMERDFQALQTEFGIELFYDKAKDGYSIHTGSEERIARLIQFVQLVHLGELFKEGLDDFDNLSRAVALEDGSRFTGIGLIRPLLLAIKKNQTVTFNYENYTKGTENRYHITPLRIKQYEGRWYVVGVPEDRKKIRTFGLDRIHGLEPGAVSQINPAHFEDQMGKFNAVVGLNYDAAEKREQITLSVTDQQLKYLKSLPLHQSQKVGERMDNRTTAVSYFLIPNYEFKMQVLKMGDQVTLLGPQWLRDEIKQTLERTLKNYTP